MNEPNAYPEPQAKQFADMLARPPVVPDPVFQPAKYLADFGMFHFQELLRYWKRPELIPQIKANDGTRQMVMLHMGGLALWAFDFEEKSEQGVSGRDEFLDRVKEPIRRPPAHMAAFTVEQHVVARGVLKIQVGGGESVPGQYEICQLKTLGWYVARMVSPKG